MALNKVMLIGNVGKDPEVRHLEGGSVVASFSLATTEKYRDRNNELKETTEWHNIVCWRALAELADKYIRKGTQIYVEGKIRTRSWEDQSGQKRYTTEILADSIQLLGRKADNPSGQGGSSYTQSTPYQSQQSPYQSQPTPSNNQASTNTNDDMPFAGGSDEDDLPF